jgi:hypothetical protein
MAERHYEFRQRLNHVHQPDRRDPRLAPAAGEVAVTADWAIVIAADASEYLRGVAADLQDYFLTSMAVALPLRPAADLVGTAAAGVNVIVLGTRKELPRHGKGLSVARSFRLTTRAAAVVICGSDERGTAQGCYYLEDLLNLREGPLFSVGLAETRAPVFSPRMVHSGWGLDRFPDPHLNAIAHAGMDAILVFVKDVDVTAGGVLDLNDLVARAARFGLDVYLYSYLRSLKHPDDPDALAHYESTYGAIFKACPGARGIVLVGESVEFPSRDERTTRRPYDQKPPDGIPDGRPSPGWWPCYDYPQWLNLLKRVIRQHNPLADIVFWTYNWGWAPEKDRLALLRTIPDDVTLLVTFEMFEPVQREGVTHICVDYTASTVGPGRYFRSEAQAAHRRGLRLYTMCNTGGMTWDFGLVPYEPVPFQWARRHAALLDAHRRWGLSGLMESHHFGWSPSIVSELAKCAYWTPQVPVAEVAARLARRDFGPRGGPLALQAWQAWSEAINDYVPTNEDQYGPFRVGPSYPLVFKPVFSRTFSSTDAPIPSMPQAHFGSRIVFTDYRPLELPEQSPGPCRVGLEIRLLQRLLQRWREGTERLESAVRAAPLRKRAAGRRMLALGRFIEHTTVTVIHVKQWWVCTQRLLVAADPVQAKAILDEMVAIAEDEIRNARAAIPVVESDSRLGWEPTMEYLADREHLEWKIRQVRYVLAQQIPSYRRALAVTEPARSPASQP